MSAGDEVLTEKRGGVGLITLNRPAALNALTHEMCLDMHRQLLRWADDKDIHAVCVVGAGDRAFCAGGDIRALYDSGQQGTPYAKQFYADEYQLNRYIKRYSKPYIAFVDGITMGGGVGISVHGSHRIAGDDILFSMPETGIGLFPDVGGSYFLPRLPGEIGMYLALTGARLKTADTIYCGIATHYIPSGRHHAVLQDLQSEKDVDAVINSYARKVEAPPLAEHRKKIDSIFSGKSVEDIIKRLEADKSEWAENTAKTILSKSPTSLKITYRQIRDGRTLNIEDCMVMEYRLARRVMEGHDFYEGVRATVIDKDKKPKWKPWRLEDVIPGQVNRYFLPLGDKDLQFG